VKMPRALGRLCAALLVLSAHAASARDTWTTPHTGVRVLERVTDRPWRISAAKIDLCARGVSVRATAAAEKRRTVSSFAERVGAEVATNADFFTYADYNPTGFAMSGGEVWHADLRGSGDVLFGDDRALLNTPTSALLSPPPAWAREGVGGRPILVDNGEVLPRFSRGDCADRHPRTAIGFTEDRRTMIMLVVDGRSNASVGMNCAELATTMHGLGAWRAMNLDGGGSSAMYVRGRGVLNDPSDGSQRVVANHLAVQATGSGAPGNCDFTYGEALDQAGVLATPGGTDVNNDGRADICGRAEAGFRCVLALPEGGFGGLWEVPGTGDAHGFDVASRYATFRTGDVTGDGRDDVCARGGEGVRCWPAGEAGFGAPIDGPAWSDDAGWTSARYYSTLRLADTNGDGLLDVCARTAAGVRCHRATGAGFEAEPTLGPAWSDDAGFGDPDHFGTLRFGDFTGDGRADVCMRAAVGVRCAPATEDGFGPEIEGPAWSDDAGFDDVSQWSTLRFEDLDGDRRADLCARTPDGLRCALSTGEGFGETFDGPAFRNDNGWSDHDNYGTLRVGDVDGDGDQDLCARGNARFYCWLYAGRAFAQRIDGPELSDAAGWGAYFYNTSIRLADVNADGRADVCARGSAGARCWLSLGLSFGDAVTGPAWTDEAGWDARKYSSTLRIADDARLNPVPPAPREDASVPDAHAHDSATRLEDADHDAMLDVAVDATLEPARDAPSSADARAPSVDASPPAPNALNRGVRSTGGCGTRPGPAAPSAWGALFAALAVARRRRVLSNLRDLNAAEPTCTVRAMNRRLSCALSALLALASLPLMGCDDPIESDDAVVVRGTLKTALNATQGTLQIVALGGNRRSSTVDVAADGSFVLPVVRNRAYTLNLLDSATQTFLGSFLYRAGQNVTLSLSFGTDEIDLGICQLQNGEVFCENGFFDSPMQSGAVTPATDAVGAIRATVEAADADRALLERLLGGLTFNLEIQANPDEPFHVALYNKTRAGCDEPFIGSGEANGDERYFYAQQSYGNATCQATVRYQANCTMKAGVCDGYLRLDVLSSGEDCSDYPPTHVAHPVRFEVLDTTARTCALPERCTENEACASGLCDFDSGFCRAQTERAPPLRIFAFDVGQGDATLIVTPKGGAVLVDGGRTASGRVLAGLVKRLAGRLDYVVATHFDGDHVSGLSAIARGLDGAPGKKFVDDNANGMVDEDAEIGATSSDDVLPRVALDRGVDTPSPNLDAWTKAFGAVRRVAMPGEVLTLPDEDVRMTVVISNGRVMGGATFPTPDENDKSVGLLVEYGGFRYLTLGDLPGGASGTRPMEQAVAEAIVDRLPVDVLHLSHHGSGASSQPNFLAATQPTVATISVGDSETCGAHFNTYGLPTQGVLDALNAQPTLRAVYQTEVGGASFGASCTPEANQTTPRNYGRLKREFTYGTLTVEAYPSSFRVSGLTFDDFYPTHAAP